MPYRSAVTGKYVDADYAKTNPDTTVWEDDEEEGGDNSGTSEQPQQEDPKLTQGG